MDLVVYRLPVPALLRQVASAYEIEAAAEPVEGLDRVWHVGVDRARSGVAYSFFFILATEPADYRLRVAALCSRVATPFLLVAPTNRFHRFETIRLLEARGSRFLALADAIRAGARGWCLTESARDGRAAFCERHRPKHARAALPGFPLPPGAGWRDVRIRFLDGESVTVFVGDFQKAVNYTQMGFNDGRNSQPNLQ